MTQEIKNKTPSHLEFPLTLLKLAIDGSFWNYYFKQSHPYLSLPSRVCKRESIGLPHLFHRLHSTMLTANYLGPCCYSSQL